MMTGKITITVWEERKIKNFLEIFPPWQERERERWLYHVALATSTVVPGFACLVGFVKRSQQEREREVR